MKASSTFAILSILLAPFTEAWLPTPGNPSLFTQSQQKIRGVNLGNLFVFEPVYAPDEWHNVIKCTDSQRSENDCVKYLGQRAANTNFNTHWHSWVNQSDITLMARYGLNTIRIPVGFWMFEGLVRANGGETFPQAGFAYLQQICAWAANAGMYVIIDLHGAPGAQVSNNPDTGYYVDPPNFPNNSTNYERAYTFIDTMARFIHNTTAFRTVGMLELLNEPLRNVSASRTTLSTYYPTAIDRIRTVESDFPPNPPSTPSTYISGSKYAPVAYDHHEYVANNGALGAKVGYPTQQEILDFTCSVDVSSDHNAPKVVGEFGITVSRNVSNDADFLPNSANVPFYARYFAAIQQTAERNSLGWISWTWKSELGYRSSYVDAVAAGVINRNLTVSATNASVCQ